MNDGYFPLDMSGWPAAPEGPADGAQHVIVDYPADWHDGGAAVSFADGSVRVRRWQDRRTTPRRLGGPMPLNVPSPHNPDVAWLQEHGTRWVP
jgi:prepilin-type processing-associated H-X9-DG protein